MYEQVEIRAVHTCFVTWRGGGGRKLIFPTVYAEHFTFWGLVVAWPVQNINPYDNIICHVRGKIWKCLVPRISVPPNVSVCRLSWWRTSLNRVMLDLVHDFQGPLKWTDKSWCHSMCDRVSVKFDLLPCVGKYVSFLVFWLMLLTTCRTARKP